MWRIGYVAGYAWWHITGWGSLDTYRRLARFDRKLDSIPYFVSGMQAARKASS